MTDQTSTIWSFVDLSTGEFTGGEAVGPLSVGFAQPAGILPVLGRWPRAEWRYDLALQRVVPKPTAELDPAATAMQQAREAARAARIEISDAEHTLARPLREVLLALIDGTQPPAAAVQRLRDADATCQLARQLINAQPVQAPA